MSKPKLTRNADGSTTVSIDRLRSVGIYNVVEVVAHRVLRLDDETLHEIEFTGGGRATLRYTKTGVVKEFRTVELKTTLTEQGEILLRRK